MFKKIMTPVDLLHEKNLDKALNCSADLAKQYNAQVIYVGVTGSGPSELAHNPKEYSEKLAAFTSEQASKHGVSATSHMKHCNDLTTDLDDALLEAIHDTKADLVVMQSHIPNVKDYVWPSNGGKIAGHSDVSVMIVRD